MPGTACRRQRAGWAACAHAQRHPAPGGGIVAGADRLHARHALQVGDEGGGLKAQRAKVDELAAALHEHQVVKRLKHLCGEGFLGGAWGAL